MNPADGEPIDAMAAIGDVDTRDEFLADITAAARVLDVAEAVVVTAGAGMGVDSGLPGLRAD